MKNQMAKLIDKLNKKPRFMRGWLLDFALGSTVKFVGTAGIHCQKLACDEAIFCLKNRKKVQNHIKGVHAAASALLAETATGMIVGMNLPDDKLPLLKSMNIQYVKRATGSLKAVARLSPEQIEAMFQHEKGDVVVPVAVTDDAGIEPVICEMCWAWIPKQR